MANLIVPDIRLVYNEPKYSNPPDYAVLLEIIDLILWLFSVMVRT